MNRQNRTHTKFWERDTNVGMFRDLKILIVEISSTGDPKSFGYTTSRNRWPTILDNVTQDVQETMDASSLDKAKEGKQIITAVERLRNEVLNDTPLK